MKILLVEDDEFFQKFYTFKLQEKGYEVVNALNGDVGLEKMRLVHPDLVLLDIIMPQKNGFDVLTEKKADLTISSIPVIVFSTLGQEDDMKKALTLGAQSYVNKSFFDFDTLSAKINEFSTLHSKAS